MDPDLDALTFIMAVEEYGADSLTVKQYVDGMAELIRTRLAFNLQGSWGRAAMALIDGGVIDRDGNVLAYPEPA